MTTATTNTIIDHTTDAAFRVWVAEVIAQLLAVGLTQTGDTGQINTATVTRPAINTSGGYAIFRFNDAAQATTPIFMRIEFGTGAATTNPGMWITVGQSTNGAGVINGTAIMTRVAIATLPPSSTATPYVSRFCYNAAQGVLWMAWKVGGSGNLTTSMGGFSITRSTDASGAVTTESFQLIANAANATGSATSAGFAQSISQLTGIASVATPFPSALWAFQPFGLLVTLYASNAQCFPVFQFTPVVGINASMALALIGEVGMHSTVTLALVGATTHTFIQMGGSPHGGSSIAGAASNSSVVGCLMLWE